MTDDARQKRERRKILTQMGFCINCNSARSAPGKTRCAMCIEKLKQAWQRYELRRGSVHSGEATLTEPVDHFLKGR